MTIGKNMFESLALLELTLSVFLGFVSAILVEYLFDEYQERKKLRIALRGIVDELITVSKTTKELEKDRYYIDPLETPVWDSLVYGDGPDTKLGRDVQKAVVSSYRYIDKVNNWENLRSQSFFYTKEGNQMLDDRVMENRENLRKVLTETIGKIDLSIDKKAGTEDLPLP